MFHLTLLDHIRLTFGQVVHHHKAHEDTARRLTRRLWLVRLSELALLAGTIGAGVRAIVAGGAWPAVTLGCAVASLALYALSLTWQMESRLYAHRWCGAELWLIRERYYALLSELADGLIDVNGLIERRDRLMRDLRDVYAHAPLLDRPSRRRMAEPIVASATELLSDEEIDRALPPSLRKLHAEAMPEAGGQSAA